MFYNILFFPFLLRKFVAKLKFHILIMTQYFYIDANGAQVGPVNKSALSSSVISRNTMVWCQGLADWTPAGQVPDLSDIFAVVPPTYAPRPRYPQPGPARPMQPAAAGKPDSFMWLAILSTILCCLPLGIVSIVYACKVDSLWTAGDQEGAQRSSNNARNWGIAAAVTGVVLALVIYLIIVNSRPSYYDLDFLY